MTAGSRHRAEEVDGDWDREEDAPRGAAEFPGAAPTDDADLRHLVGVGSLWFAAALVGTGLPLAGLLSAGWRPGQLPAVIETVWWCASAVAAAGTVALAWAGCPVIERDPAASARRKSVSIRAGVVLLLVGQAAALSAVLLR